jgi:acyl-CoA thioesterase I
MLGKQVSEVVAVSSAGSDIRICLFGDSYVQGVGDPTGGGWVAAVLQATEATVGVIAYRLGVCGDTALDVQRRWYDEARCRLKDGDRYGVIFSFGVNDTHLHGGRVRVSSERSLAVLAVMLDDAHVAGWPTLVIGPPPPAEDGHRARVRQLSTDMAIACTDRAVPFVDLATPLDTDENWLGELAAGDGNHPGTAGYRRLAGLIRPAFISWAATVAGPDPH